MNSRATVAVAVATLLGVSTAFAAETASPQSSMEELRNTVINLLEGLVDRGVLTREQAEKMVRDAQQKARADAARADAVVRGEEGAVRVPYVPEVVKEEIRKQVSTDLSKEVTANVV